MFNPTTLALQVIGVDAVSGIASVSETGCVPVTTPTPGLPGGPAGARACTCPVTDNAGNTLSVALETGVYQFPAGRPMTRIPFWAMR